MVKRILSVVVFFIVCIAAYVSADEGAPPSSKGASLMNSPGAPTAQKRGTFLDPVLKWQREFVPPLDQISDRNSGDEYIAVERGSQGSGLRDHGRILFLDSHGKTVRTIELGQTGKRLIKRDDVWLTFDGGVKDDPDILRDFKSGKWITTVTEKAYISGNGEYYGILTSDADPTSPWHEFAYYDRTGKLLWTALPEMNYFNSEIHISFDGSRVLSIDHVIEDNFGQKWYLFDSEGHLLRSSTEDMPWIEYVDMSPNGKFIAYGTREKIGLMDKDGTVIWEKEHGQFGIPRASVFDNGMVESRDIRDTVYNYKGGTICSHCAMIALFPNSNYALGYEITDDPAKSENMNIYDTSNGDINLILTGKDLSVAEVKRWFQYYDVVDANHIFRMFLDRNDSLFFMLIDIDMSTWSVRSIKHIVTEGIAISDARIHAGEFMLFERSIGIMRVHCYDVSRGVRDAE